MRNKIRAALNRLCDFTKYDTVAVALSGGSDSMCLLDNLRALSDEFGYRLCAIHVNHHIRGDEADRDEAFVKQQCKDLSVKLFSFSADIPALAAESGESLEECGRKQRYLFFDTMPENILIATAHNLNDNAETFILNLARGTGLKGLCGIPEKRGRIIRPMLSCTKDEIIAYCNEFGVKYVTDSTNGDINYSRNRIRRNVIPQMEEVNGSCLNNISRCMSTLMLDESFLEQSTENAVKQCEDASGDFYSVSPLLSLHEAIRTRALACIIERLTGQTPEYRHIIVLEKMLTTGGGVSVTGGKTVYSDTHRIFLKQKPSCNNQDFLFYIDNYPCQIQTPLYTVYFFRDEDVINISQTIINSVFQYSIDYDRISGVVCLRSRQEADKIRLAGRNCTKTVRKLFTEAKLPCEKRASVPLLADNASVILIAGFGVDEKFAVNKSTKHKLNILFTEG